MVCIIVFNNRTFIYKTEKYKLYQARFKKLFFLVKNWRFFLVIWAKKIFELIITLRLVILELN